MSMSKWNHTLCAECYASREPGRKPPAVDAPDAVCCACGRLAPTVYYRAEPESFNCRGGLMHEAD